ncbi:hypothetical protein Q428_14165, partial [Fervidicella metallireducens AeB]
DYYNYLQYIPKKSHIRYVFAITVLIFAVLTLSFYQLRRKTITIIDYGRKTKIITYKNTVKDVLESNNISLNAKDKVEPSLTSKIADDGTITIKRAVNVKVIVDGKQINIESSEGDVASMLKSEGIEIREHDKIKPGLDTKLSSNMEIEITKVDIKTIDQKVEVNFKEIIKKDKKLSNTKTKVLQEGKKGEKLITIQVIYENGQEVARKVIKEILLKKPADRLVLQGSYPHMPVSRGGRVLPFKKVINARATAYWAVRGVGKTYTASGRLAVRNEDGYSTIAVDPKVIPYGTKLFVEGYGFAIAADTGTAIKGNKIDVFFNTFKEACNWAVKNVKVYILN